MAKNFLEIANTQAFWGDQPDASSKLLALHPTLDYITQDYLSEVSMSIMAIQKEKDPALGYARDFIEVVKSLIPFWQKGSKVKLVTNAGGLNPLSCAEECKKVLQQHGCHKRIAVVLGDDVLQTLKSDIHNPLFSNMESKEDLKTIINSLSTANAYLGAEQIAHALKNGAEIVITGRVADPSLTVGPSLAYFGWDLDDYKKIAGATVAGHLIECGTQVTGGISTKWLSLENQVNIGFPIAEIYEDGSCIITKADHTDGIVDEEVVKEQLLYEIGDPGQYLSPDATVSFLGLQVKQQGKNRVHVDGAVGSAPPLTYKVSATYRDGYKAEAFLALFGRDVRKKAEISAAVIQERISQAMGNPEKFQIDIFTNEGSNIVPGVTSSECLMRMAAYDHRKEVLELFSREIAPMVTSGPQGITGYTGGRPHIREVYGFWPCLIEKRCLKPKVEFV